MSRQIPIFDSWGNQLGSLTEGAGGFGLLPFIGGLILLHIFYPYCCCVEIMIIGLFFLIRAIINRASPEKRPLLGIIITILFLVGICSFFFLMMLLFYLAPMISNTLS